MTEGCHVVALRCANGQFNTSLGLIDDLWFILKLL
jgi:hypothetical protein